MKKIASRSNLEPARKEQLWKVALITKMPKRDHQSKYRHHGRKYDWTIHNALYNAIWNKTNSVHEKTDHWFKLFCKKMPKLPRILHWKIFNDYLYGDLKLVFVQVWDIHFQMPARYLVSQRKKNHQSSHSMYSTITLNQRWQVQTCRAN